MEELFGEESSLQERLYPYKLNLKQTFHALLIIAIIMMLFVLSVSPIFDLDLRLPSLSGYLTENDIETRTIDFTVLILLAVGIVGIYLLGSIIKAYGLYIELKAYRDIYETLRWGELKDIFLDELFNVIRMVRFKGISEMFYSGPRNPSLVAALNACEHRSESVNTKIDGIPIKDLTLHSIYKLASKRELRSINIISKTDKECECEASICLRFNFKNDRDEK